jgi:ABC-type sugar transport system ATPase subunit
MNFLPARAIREDGCIVLSGSGFSVRLTAERAVDLPANVVMGVRPEDLDGPSPSTEDTIAAKVSVKEQLGHSLLVYGDVDGTQIVASLEPHRQVSIDEEIRLKANVKAIHVFHPETLETLI